MNSLLRDWIKSKHNNTTTSNRNTKALKYRICLDWLENTFQRILKYIIMFVDNSCLRTIRPSWRE